MQRLSKYVRDKTELAAVEKEIASLKLTQDLISY